MPYPSKTGNGTDFLTPATTQKPYSQYAYQQNLSPVRTGYGPVPGSTIALLRDNFTIPTWILIGAVLQVTVTLVLPRSYAAFPALLALLAGIGDSVLISLGLKHNRWKDGVIHGKVSVAYPPTADDHASKEASDIQPSLNGPGAVMILGAKSNGPFGMFQEGYKEIADRFKDMVTQLEEEKATNGFMGMSSWISAGERVASNELTTISYWRSIEDVHQFACSPVHMDAWRWWDSTIKKHDMLGIMHEIFEVPKSSGWEGVYINFRPTGMAATTKPVVNGKGELEWHNPVVDATRGVWKSSRGRLARSSAGGDGYDSAITSLEHGSGGKSVRFS